MFRIARVVLAASLLAGGFALNLPAAPVVEAACGVSIYRIYYDSPGTDNGSNSSLNAEWIQLRNNCTVGVSLYRWTVRDTASHVYRFGTYTLAAGGKVKVHTGGGSNTATDRFWNQDFYVWNNDKDTAKLRNAAGTQVDSCSYVDSGSASSRYC